MATPALLGGRIATSVEPSAAKSNVQSPVETRGASGFRRRTVRQVRSACSRIAYGDRWATACGPGKPRVNGMISHEAQLEQHLIEKLQELKVASRDDIRDRKALDANFRKRLQDFNRVPFPDAECPHRLEQVVKYKNDPGNDDTKTLRCFVQLFMVSNRDQTCDFADKDARPFAFEAEERYLPIDQFADP